VEPIVEHAFEPVTRLNPATTTTTTTTTTGGGGGIRGSGAWVHGDAGRGSKLHADVRGGAAETET
jgi:hypothetical protein